MNDLEEIDLAIELRFRFLIHLIKTLCRYYLPEMMNDVDGRWSSNVDGDDGLRDSEDTEIKNKRFLSENIMAS